ncbi:DUF4395 domain-containing protein [Nocardioides immobilis]|uniref:DUF4395 domain-containing protein n=1 Tax=Nocardioides immobilis TaxID=2049295 RepID=A0A417Y9G6_9ACTN|nr:DUF4395 domain-containing protein [Nocardioides immobilis]RHW29156.1 DUF4395 domain-containing protein [Nocardioides immobilis]
MTGAAGIDPRGPRFTASVTAVLLAAALVVPEGIATAVVGALAVFFAIGAGLGVQRTPTGVLFRTLIRPRLTPPAELEDPTPPRFAQAVGLTFAVVAVVGYLTGTVLVAQVAVGLALVAALLNAVFGFCLGCEMYLLGARFRSARATP